MNKITTGVISLAIMVVLVAGVATPIISATINDSSNNSEDEAGERFFYNPSLYRYVDLIEMYEDGVFSDDTITVAELEESYLIAYAEAPSILLQMIVQWEGDDSPTYIVCSEKYATDGTNCVFGIYLTDVDFEARTCTYNIETDNVTSETRTFTSLKLGMVLDNNWFAPYYYGSNEGMYLGDIELASLEGVTTIGIATDDNGGNYSDLVAFAVNESVTYPVGGSVTRNISYADHILDSVTYTYPNADANTTSDVVIIAPVEGSYDTTDGKISGNDVCIGRFVDAHEYLLAVQGTDDVRVSLAGGFDGYYSSARNVSPAITAIVTSDVEGFSPVTYAWEYTPFYREYPCISSGSRIYLPSTTSSVMFMMDDVNWNDKTCTMYLSNPDVGMNDFHYTDVKILMREADIGYATDVDAAMALYKNATMSLFGADTDIHLDSVDDITVIGQEVTEDKTSDLVWAINGENKSEVQGTLTYSPSYSNHVLSGVTYTFNSGGTSVNMMPIGVIAPTSFEYDNTSGGGPGGLSPVLTTVISLIPLLMAVGVLIGAISMYRMKM